MPSFELLNLLFDKDVDSRSSTSAELQPLIMVGFVLVHPEFLPFPEQSSREDVGYAC